MVMAVNLNNNIFSDERGSFLETWSTDWNIDPNLELRQSNIVWTHAALTLRGFHAQRPPRAMTKVVRVLQGEIVDVFVNAMKGSEGYGDWQAVHLKEPGQAVVVPHGYYHGYVTLTANTIVQYHQTDTWSKEHEVGINWRSARYVLDRFVDVSQLIVNERDDTFPDWTQGFKF